MKGRTATVHYERKIGAAVFERVGPEGVSKYDSAFISTVDNPCQGLEVVEVCENAMSATRLVSKDPKRPKDKLGFPLTSLTQRRTGGGQVVALLHDVAGCRDGVRLL